MTDDDLKKGTGGVVRSDKERVEVAHQPRERIPFGVPRSRLSVIGSIPGYTLGWINDTGGRIEEAQLGGYEFVKRNEIKLAVGMDGDVTPHNSDLGDRISMIVGMQGNRTNEPLRAYLMKIRNEYREESRQILRDIRNKRLGSIKRGQTVAVADGDKFYVPDHSPIRISTKKP